MSNVPLLTTGLQIPSDFAVVPYERIYQRMYAGRVNNPNAWLQYICAWEAVVYRFRSCAECDEEYTQAIEQCGGGPPPDIRYIQERALFGFFVAGLAVIEILCYGIFAIGSMLKQEEFPVETFRDRKKINPVYTQKRFIAVYGKAEVTNALCKMVNAPEYRTWGQIRNILCHRMLPGRHGRIGGTYHGKVSWNLPLDKEPLFSTEIKHQSDLDKGNIPDELNTRIALSENATTVTLQRDIWWLITDSKKDYHIRKESSILNVYKGVRIDGNTTASRRKWLAATVYDILNAIDRFTMRNFT